MKILMVDDDPSVHRIADAALGDDPRWQLEHADSAEEALEIIRDRPPEALLLDRRLPGIDGPELIARLRDDPALPELPVVFLTASSAAEEVAALEATGARGVICKPFRADALGDELARLLA